jgi:hypothetical protein
MGLVSGYSDVEHFSIYPYARYAFFIPFNNGGGWHAGAGAGYKYVNYTFSNGEVSDGFILADISTGIIFRNGITISYSFRTNFETANNKVAVGYSFRF